MRLNDLPPNLRAQAEAKLGQLGAPKRKRDTSTATGTGLLLRCSRCPFTTDQPTEDRLTAHTATHPGGCRYEWRAGHTP